jgi:sec-independent protein translocase protein TatB
MFDIGFSELLVIAVVALVVLGPERLPKAARFTGLWVRRARAQWYSVKAELEQDLAADELKRSLRDTEDAMRRAQSGLRDAGDSVRQGFDEARLDAVRDEVESPASPPTPQPAQQPPADDDARR